MPQNTHTDAQPLSSEMQEKIESIVNAVLQGETTLQTELDISPDQLEALYAAAYNLFQSKKYTDALRAFNLLQVMAPTDSRFVFGCASCMQMLEKYAEAALCYQLSAAYDQQNPAPMLHSAECFIALGDKPAAREALRYTLELCAVSPLGLMLRGRAEVMLDNIGHED